jgi:hypothetical protein
MFTTGWRRWLASVPDGFERAGPGLDLAEQGDGGGVVVRCEV